MTRKFKDLSSPEVLALAISLEEEDGRIYLLYAVAGESGIAIAEVLLNT